MSKIYFRLTNNHAGDSTVSPAAVHKHSPSPKLFSYILKTAVLLVTALVLLGPPLWPQKIRAATLTWDGGCGADTNWSCDNNWSTNTEPLAGDTVVFDNTSDNNS